MAEAKTFGLDENAGLILDALGISAADLLRTEGDTRIRLQVPTDPERARHIDDRLRTDTIEDLYRR